MIDRTVRHPNGALPNTRAGWSGSRIGHVLTDHPVLGVSGWTLPHNGCRAYQADLAPPL
jgi:hypothetical protein